MKLSRVLCMVVMGCVVSGCDPIRTRGLSVGPDPALQGEQAYERAAALTSIIATQHDLRLGEAAPYNAEQAAQCHRGYDDTIFLCVAARAGGVQFYFSETGFELSPRARSIWAELQEAVRTEFGTAAVRDCRWNGRPNPERLHDERGARVDCVLRSNS